MNVNTGQTLKDFLQNFKSMVSSFSKRNVSFSNNLWNIWGMSSKNLENLPTLAITAIEQLSRPQNLRQV